MDIHGLRQQTTNTLQRLFKMSFVPAGFWERFIARMLISLTEMDLQVVQQQHLKVAHGSHSHSESTIAWYTSVMGSRASLTRLTLARKTINRHT